LGRLFTKKYDDEFGTGHSTGKESLIYDLERDRDRLDFFSGVLLRLLLRLADLLLDFLSRDRLRESLRSDLDLDRDLFFDLDFERDLFGGDRDRRGDRDRDRLPSSHSSRITSFNDTVRPFNSRPSRSSIALSASFFLS